MTTAAAAKEMTIYSVPTNRSRTRIEPLHAALAAAGARLVMGVLVWQGITAAGNPDPVAEGISRSAAVMNAGIVVFREGLEAILVLAALTASMARKRQDSWRPIALGAAISFAASV